MKRLFSIQLALSLLAAACGKSGDAARQAHSSIDTVTFVAHEGYVAAGLPAQRAMATLRNPHDGDTRAMTQGKSLYVNYNCIDCHGADGSGAMGPSLQDGRWHFGGSAGEVFQSIYEGRPAGMPAWGGRISDDQIWLLVSYVRSLQEGHEPTTEDFRGGTEARTGH
jgi:cytochrome c oxidase cbb3-type subunit 3